MVVNAKNSGSSDLPTSSDPGAIPALRNSVSADATISVAIPPQQRLGHIALGVARLLRRQRQLFYG